MTQAHHRRDFEAGPWRSWSRTKARTLSKLAAPGRVLERLVGAARRVGPDLYHIPGGAAAFLAAKAALDDWRPLAGDTSGDLL